MNYSLQCRCDNQIRFSRVIFKLLITTDRTVTCDSCGSEYTLHIEKRRVG